MVGYYLELAIRSLRRNVMLTVLTVAAVGAGIGASMTMLTTLRAMSGNPIPEKSSQLFVPLIDVWGPDSRDGSSNPDWLPSTFTYRDATAFTKAHMGLRQAAMFRMNMDVSPTTGIPFQASGRATYADFFAMFDVPFGAGAPWGQKRMKVAITSWCSAQSWPSGCFRTAGRSAGRSASMAATTGWSVWSAPGRRRRDSTICFPRGAVLMGTARSSSFPFSNAIDRQLRVQGATGCNGPPPAGWEARLNSECVWMQFWVELPTAAQVRNFPPSFKATPLSSARTGAFIGRRW